MAKDRTTCVCCFENARDEHRHGACRLYITQRAFTKRVRRLLADTTPWHQRPVPVNDWSPAGMATWNRAHMSDYPPPQAPEVKAFRKALEALGDWRRDASPTTAGGACAECLFQAHATAQAHWSPGFTSLRSIPHTCAIGARVLAVNPKPARRRTAA